MHVNGGWIRFEPLVIADRHRMYITLLKIPNISRFRDFNRYRL